MPGLPLTARAIIFDLDGVLWDSSSAHADAFARVLAPEGITGFDYLAHAGMRTDDVFRQVMTKAGRVATPDQVQAWVASKRRFAIETLTRRPPIEPDAAETLHALSKTHLLALASSSSPANVELFLDATRARELFQTVLSGDSVEHAKPAPDIYLEALRRLGVPATEACVIEDALAGIQSARAAHCAVGGKIGTLSRRELEAAGVDFLIDRLKDLVLVS